MRFYRPIVLSLVVVPLLAGCAFGIGNRRADAQADALAQIEPIDVPAFMGKWYVLARISNVIERGHIGGQFVYAQESDTRVKIEYIYRNGQNEDWRQMRMHANIVPGTGGRNWRVRFFRIVPSSQQILEVDSAGQWALLSTPTRDSAWIFARSPDIDEASYQQLREKLRGYGVDTDKVWRVIHSPQQIGQRGFDQPDR